jgi:hypothetical protein
MKFRVYVDYHTFLCYDLGLMTADEFKEFLSKNNVGYLYWLVDKEYKTDECPELNQELHDIIMNHSQERYSFDSEIHTWAQELCDDHTYILASPMTAPDYMDISPARFLINHNDQLVIPGMKDEHMNLNLCLEQCWNQAPVELNLELLYEENLRFMHIDAESTPWLKWCNEAGSVIQVIKNKGRYLIINGFSIYLNHVKMNKSTIMAQLVEI